jgi:radical SAM protein with 4Fe4S-binding SPASM domain
MINTFQGYDLRTGNILDAWTNGPEFLKIRQRNFTMKCEKCNKKQICLGGCPCWDSINIC